MDAPLLVNTGLRPNDGLGDEPRTAFDKINRNAADAHAAILDLSGAVVAVAQQASAILAAVVSGATPDGFPVRRGQFFLALEQSMAGRTSAVLAVVPPDPGDPLNRAWFHTTFVTPTSALVMLVQNTLGLTAAEMAAILANARSITDL